MIIQTITTIGYGHIYPTSHLGRFSTFLVCLFGVVVLSLFVLMVRVKYSFEDNEHEVYLKLLDRSLFSKRKKLADKIISKFIIYNHLLAK